MDYEKFGIMTTIIWGNLETDGKTWKQIFKTLTLIDFLIKNGNERIIENCRDKLYKIRSFQDYNFYEGTIDKGSGVREKAKQLIELLGNNETIRSEREKARTLRNKFVGIDSRNTGGGGYSSSDGHYGGSGGGGYGGSGSGGYGGSGGGYGGSNGSNNNGRYGNDSYSSNNNYNSNSNTGRYGGGAYDSDRPPRYGDDGNNESSDRPSKFNDSSSNQKPYSSNNEEDFAEVDSEYVAKLSKSKSTTVPKLNDKAPTSTGGKLKMNIKKSTTAESKPSTTASVPVPSEVNLLGDEIDLLSVPAPPVVAQQQSSLLDPFATPSTTANTSSFGAFDPFGSAPQPQQSFQPVPVQSFDPFAPSPSVPQPVYPTQPALQFSPPMQQQQPQQMYQQPQQQIPFNQPLNNTISYTQPIQQQQFNTPPPPIVPIQLNPPIAPAQPDNDFGDFESAKSSAASKTAIPNKWGDMGKLVDLGGIGKNEDPKKNVSSAPNNYSQNNSFAGLDGFSKTPQNMNSRPTPIGYGSPNQLPTGQSMMARPPAQPMGQQFGQPMGMGGPPMGQQQFGMGQPMGMGPPMGAGYPMGMGQPLGQPMGMGPPPMGQPNGMGQPFGLNQPMGQPQGMGQPFGMGQPISMGQPYGQGYPAQPPQQGYGQGGGYRY